MAIQNNLKIEIARINIDILGISEVRWPEAGGIWSGDYSFVYSITSAEKPGR